MRNLICLALVLSLGAACARPHKNVRSQEPDTKDKPFVVDDSALGTMTDESSHDIEQPVITNSSNPFVNARFAVDPSYAAKLEAMAVKYPASAAKFREVAAYGGTGLWIDTMESIAKLEPALLKARAQQESQGKPVVLSIVIYDLPNRDCFALASNGEIVFDAWSGNGDAALQTYQTKYIDPIASLLKKYPDIRIAAIIEPDSLPNAISNSGQLRCSPATLSGYKKGIAYALKTLAMPQTSLYLDAAHSGWLGYNDSQRHDLAVLVQDVLQMAGGAHKLHGFATNVANYTPLDQHGPRGGIDPKVYFSGDGTIRNELGYIKALSQAMEAVGIKDKSFIIDTGRNGAAAARMDWGVWCNVANARLGQKPTVAPQPKVDAYIWVKPPGESDGSGRVSLGNKGKDDACEPGKRFSQAKPDLNQDSLISNYVAGDWFEEHLLIMMGLQ